MTQGMWCAHGHPMKEAVELTIDDGVLTVTQSLVIVNGEGGLDDELHTLEFDPEFVEAGFQPPVILKAKTGLTITIKNSGGNIRLKAGTDFTLTGELLKPLLRMTATGAYSNFNDY